MIKLPEPELFFTENYGLGDVSNVWGYTEAQLKQAVRDAYEDAAKVAETTRYHESTFFANGFNQAALNIESAIRALIKEIT